jgi:hypothetical protein
MTRRLWLVILGATACVTTLSGCAQSTQNLLHARPEDRPAKQDPGLGSAEEQFGPPTRPGIHELPPGRRVPEYLQPPPVLPPLIIKPLPLPPTEAIGSQPPVNPSVQCEKPNDDHALVNALRLLLNKQPDKALPYLEQYDRATQELFIRLLPPLVLLNDKAVDQLSPTEVGTLHDELQGVLLALRTHTQLAISKLCLCDNSYGFGRVIPRRDSLFQAGDMMLIYVELCNTDCELRGEYYVSEVVGEVSISDAHGKKLWWHNYSAHDDALLFSRLPRYDCCHTYMAPLPASVPPGQYVLTMELTDKTHPLPDKTPPPPHRVTRKSIEFIVR